MPAAESTIADAGYAAALPPWIAKHDGDDRYDWARQAWVSAAAEPGAWFDYGLAEAVVAAWPSWATLTVDRFAGVPFILSDWQDIVVRLLVGWTVPADVLDPLTHREAQVQVRLFRRLLLWVPRKNGKSEFLAALALLFFAIDGVRQGEGYVFARKEEQAAVIFARMKAMIANSPPLAEGIIPYTKSLYVKRHAASFVLLSGSTEGLHGKSPTVIVGDEMHEWRSLVIADTLRQGSGGRLQPIELYASTAGRKSGGLSAGEQLYDETLAIAEGRRIEAPTLAVIFAAKDGDDPGDEATWRKANPNLGLAPLIGFLRQEWNKAKGNPRKIATFKCYHLGIWADEVSKWLPLKKWDACADDAQAWRDYPELFKGRTCYAAFDVSSTRDVTALILVFPPTPADLKWRVISRFWIPADRVAERLAEGSPVDQFIADGAMETTDGDFVDQNVVGLAIIKACEDYDVVLIGFDPWNARKLVTDLTITGGIEEGSPAIDLDRFKEMRQGILTLGEPSKHFERLVFEGMLDHGGQPVLRWMVGNAVIHFDRNLNFMPAKDRSPEKIDGVSAGVMAVGLAFLGEGVIESPWEDPEFKLARA